MIVNISNLDKKLIRENIDTNGYFIAKNVINEDFIHQQRQEYLIRMKGEKVRRKFVRGHLILGEPNFLSYSDIPAWCMYRLFEFSWNKLMDIRVMELHRVLHMFRNELQGLDASYGTEYNEENYGYYISTSLYEAGKGHLALHADGHADTPILHYMVPLTFKGIDYTEGGLYCVDRNGAKIDIDSYVNPGDIIFFDGRILHGVSLIGSGQQNIGRLAQFAIPTYFKNDARLGVYFRSIKINLLELANKLKLVDLK